MVWGNPPEPMGSPPPRPTSSSSMSSSASSRLSSPRLTPLDSSAALILVHDEDTQIPFHLDSDDDNEDDDYISHFDVHRPSTPPLSPSLVLLYLLVPYLRLGAMFLPHTQTPLSHGLPSLIVFAILAAFARQLLYMLSRYTRSAELEDVILHLFARGRGKEKRRSILRNLVRTSIGALRILLATVYLRESDHILFPLLSNGASLTLWLGLTVVGLAVAPVSFAQSIASKRIIYTTCLTFVTYIMWLICIAYAYVHHIPLGNAGWLRTGTFWQGPVTIAFAFTSSSTLSLYTSLRGSRQPITTAKPSKFRSFELLSVLSVILAFFLTLPLVIFSANPSVPETSIVSQSPVLPIIPLLNVVILVLSIPHLIVSIPSLPLPDRFRHLTSFPTSKMLLVILVAALTLVPASISAILDNILLLSALTSTYFLPAVLHVIAHFFEPPLTILTPQRAQSHEGGRSGTDELLLRKERALQKKQFRKRIVWDLGVWLLLLGGGAGFVVAIGRVVGKW